MCSDFRGLCGSEVSAFCSFMHINRFLFVPMPEFYLLCWYYALCMLLYTHYAKNYASIINAALIHTSHATPVTEFM